jgi:hypothetical protein
MKRNLELEEENLVRMSAMIPPRAEFRQVPTWPETAIGTTPTCSPHSKPKDCVLHAHPDVKLELRG